MLAHPRSHSLYALACLGVWSTYWVRPTFRRHDCRLRIRMAAARHHCSSSLRVKSGYLHRSCLFLPLPIVSALRLCSVVPVRLQPGRKRLLVGLGIASWVAVALDNVRRREFTCMHCGEKCIVKV